MLLNLILIYFNLSLMAFVFHRKLIVIFFHFLNDIAGVLLEVDIVINKDPQIFIVIYYREIMYIESFVFL